MKIALLLFVLSFSHVIAAPDIAGNGRKVKLGVSLPEGDVGGNSQGIESSPGEDVAGNGQGTDQAGGDVGGNSQDLFEYRWASAMATMKHSNLLNGHYGSNGRLATLARAVHEIVHQSPPKPRDLGEARLFYLTPSQIIETLAANVLEQLGQRDSRNVAEISVLLGADR